MSQDVFDDCERFDNDFRPEAGRKPGLEVLPDGAYDFQILSATPDRTQKERDPIVRVVVKVRGGPYDGQECEWTWWLTRQEGVDRIGGDLATLGFDTQNWRAPARPFSRELQKALPRLAGLRFRGQIKRNGQYTNLYCNARLSGVTPPPPPATTPPVAPRPAVPANVPPIHRPEDDEPLPF